MELCFSDGLIAHDGSLAIGKTVQGVDIRQLNKMTDGIADIVENIQIPFHRRTRWQYGRKGFRWR